MRKGENQGGGGKGRTHHVQDKLEGLRRDELPPPAPASPRLPWTRADLPAQRLRNDSSPSSYVPSHRAMVFPYLRK